MSVLLISGPALSADTPTFKSEKEIKDYYDKKRATANELIKSYTKVYNDLEYGLGNTKENTPNPTKYGLAWHRQKISDFQNEINSINKDMDSKSLPEQQAALKRKFELESNLAIWKKEIMTPTNLEALKDHQNQIKKLNADLSLAEVQEKAAKAGLETQVARLETQVKARGLGSDSSDLEKQVQDVDKSYAIIAAKYDNADIRFYLQKKFSNLVNSDVLCASVDQCEGGSRKADAPKINDLSEVFDQIRKAAPPKRTGAGGAGGGIPSR